MNKAKAPLWGEILYHMGDLYRGTASEDDLMEKLKAAGFDGKMDAIDCDEHPLARYLRSRMPGIPIYVGMNFVSLEYGDGGTLSISLPRKHEWGEEAQPTARKASSRNRLADSLWDGLDDIGIAYDRDAEDVIGTPPVAIRDKKIAIFTRRCHAYDHSCMGGDELKHTGIVRELRAKGWTVYTLWECQLRGNCAHLEVLLSALKGG
jgi:G:T-mismatch repair DNA endonuclease (very short patch repair protein)